MTANNSLIRPKGAAAKLGIALSTLNDWLNPRSPRYDPTLPARIRIGKSAVAWREADLDAWIDSRAEPTKL